MYLVPLQTYFHEKPLIAELGIQTGVQKCVAGGMVCAALNGGDRGHGGNVQEGCNMPLNC